MEDMGMFLQLVVRVLCDQEPGDRANIPIYLVGQTEDNQASVFGRLAMWDAATRHHGLRPTNPVAISAGSTSGYPGAETWARELALRGVHTIRIRRVPCAGQLNTLTELESLVQYAGESGWNEIVMMAAPFHQLRSFLTIVGAIRRQRSSLRVYNVPGIALPWGEEALHSQGVLRATRSQLVVEEHARIVRYTERGDLATVSQAMEYLDRRS